MAKRKKGTPLKNIRHERFCNVFISPDEFFGNGVQSYIKAYNIDTTKKGAYDGAKANAYSLLTNTYILARIDELLDMDGLNDQHVDKQLAILITQKAELSTSVAAIREYNKLKSRIAREEKDMVVHINVISPDKPK